MRSGPDIASSRVRKANSATELGVIPKSDGSVTAPSAPEDAIHAHLLPRGCRLNVSLSPQRNAGPPVSTIELVGPELRDALALWPVLPLSAGSLAERRATALAASAAIPRPHLPDITADEIHVESVFGARPIRVLAYRPVTSDAPLPAMVHILGGGFVMERI